MRFTHDDPCWSETLAVLRSHCAPLLPILAPNEFLLPLPGTYHYNVSRLFPLGHFEAIVVHKAMTGEIAPRR